MLNLIGFIDYRNYDTAKLIYDLAHKKDKTSVDIHVDSIGGYCYSARLIQKQLRKYKTVNFYLGDRACSEAANILTFGKVRDIKPNTRVLFHIIHLSFTTSTEVITKEKYELLKHGNIDPNVFESYENYSDLMLQLKTQICADYRYAYRILMKAKRKGFITKEEFDRIVLRGVDIVLTGEEFKNRIGL